LDVASGRTIAHHQGDASAIQIHSSDQNDGATQEHASPLLHILRERKQQRNASLSPSDATVLSFNNTHSNQCRTRIVYDLRDMQKGGMKKTRRMKKKNKRPQSSKKFENNVNQNAARESHRQDTASTNCSAVPPPSKPPVPSQQKRFSSTTKQKSKSSSNKENTPNKSTTSRRKSMTKYTNIRMPSRPKIIDPLPKETSTGTPVSASTTSSDKAAPTLLNQQHKVSSQSRKRRGSVQKIVQSKKIILDTSVHTPNEVDEPLMIELPTQEEHRDEIRSPFDQDTHLSHAEIPSPAKTEEVERSTSVGAETDGETAQRQHQRKQSPIRHERKSISTQTPSKKNPTPRKHNEHVRRAPASSLDDAVSSQPQGPRLRRRKRQTTKVPAARKSKARATLENIRQVFSSSARITPNQKRRSVKSSHRRRSSSVSDLEAIPIQKEILKERPMYLDSEFDDSSTAQSVPMQPKVEIRLRATSKHRSSTSGHATKSEIRALLLQSKSNTHGATQDDPTLKERLKQSFERSRRIKERLWLQKYGDLLSDTEDAAKDAENAVEEELLSESTRQQINMTSPSRVDDSPPRGHHARVVSPFSLAHGDSSTLEESPWFDSAQSRKNRWQEMSLDDVTSRGSCGMNCSDTESNACTQNNTSVRGAATPDGLIESLLDSEDDSTPLEELEKTLEEQHRMLIHEGILSEDDDDDADE